MLTRTLTSYNSSQQHHFPSCLLTSTPTEELQYCMYRSNWSLQQEVTSRLRQCRGSVSMKGLISHSYLSENTLMARFLGPTWGLSGADRTQIGPMLAPWTLLSGYCSCVSCFQDSILIGICTCHNEWAVVSWVNWFIVHFIMKCVRAYIHFY